MTGKRVHGEHVTPTVTSRKRCRGSTNWESWAVTPREHLECQLEKGFCELSESAREGGSFYHLQHGRGKHRHHPTTLPSRMKEKTMAKRAEEWTGRRKVGRRPKRRGEGPGWVKGEKVSEETGGVGSRGSTRVFYWWYCFRPRWRGYLNPKRIG